MHFLDFEIVGYLFQYNNLTLKSRAEAASQWNYFRPLYEQYENTLISTKINFNNFTKEYLELVKSNLITIPWTWRISPVNVANIKHRYGMLHDKHNPHLPQMLRLFLLVQESGLLKAYRPDVIEASLDVSVNPYKSSDVNFASKTIRLAHMTQIVILLFIGIDIAMLSFLFEEISTMDGTFSSEKTSTANAKIAWKQQSGNTNGKRNFVKVIFYILFSVALITIIIFIFDGENKVDSGSDLFAFGTMLPSSFASLAFEKVCPERPSDSFAGVIRGYVYSERHNYSICYEVLEQPQCEYLKYLWHLFSDLGTIHVQMSSEMG